MAFANVGIQTDHDSSGPVTIQLSSDSVCHLSHGSVLTFNNLVKKVVIGIERTHSEYARIPYFYFLPRPEDTTAALGELTTFDFKVWDSRKRCRFLALRVLLTPYPG